MTHKQDAPSESFVLPNWQVVEANGSDAAAFLQAQLMNDVRALEVGHWQWNGWLNPKGRLIALFALVALDEQRYWLVVPDFPVDELVNRLQRFVFRSKVKLLARDDCAVTGAFAQPAHAQGSMLSHEAISPGMITPEMISHDAMTNAVELDFSADTGTRTLRIVQKPFSANGDAADANAANVLRWNAFDLAHGLPRLTMEQSEQWTPQMLALDRLNAYSLKKGCYPGQEIVARTHYLGQAKRGLVRIGGDGLAVAAEIVAAGRTLGTIVSSIGDEALAVLSADRPADGWECNGSPCHELPLLGGLAR